MVTEEQVQTFKMKMREIMSAHSKMLGYEISDIFTPEFQKAYASLLRLESEAEQLFVEYVGHETALNFIKEAEDHFLSEAWCREILK